MQRSLTERSPTVAVGTATVPAMTTGVGTPAGLHSDCDDTVALAARIRSRELSPVEAVTAAIERIEATDGELNAVIHRSFERALDQAASPDLPDGPFRGVPFLLKDLWPASAGDPFHLGVRGLKAAGYVAPIDSHITTRYREAGFVLVGRTNTPELGLVATTEPLAYGPSRNPWNADHGTGGSSGGAAAAVAAGMVPAANASDGGGSIRIPAAMCGLVGLKPSRGRVPMGPYQDEWGLSCQHVVCTTVRDSAAILDVTARPTLGDGVVAPDHRRPYLSGLDHDPGRLRIGVWAEAPRGDIDLDPTCAASARAAGRLLERLGHDVTNSHPAALDGGEFGASFSAVWMVNARVNLDTLGQWIGRPLTADDVEPGTWLMAEGARNLSAIDLAASQGAMHRFRRETATWWEQGYDLLLTPTTAQPPPPIGDITGTDDDPMRNSMRSIPYAAYTSPFNVTGQPAISLPLHRSTDGLPVGIQLVAAYGREDLLFAVAAQLEAEVMWNSVLEVTDV